jgi:DNA helicase-2/ATP-dependent DNA helicase PcrA
MRLIEQTAEQVRSLDLHEQVDRVIQKSGLIPHFEKDTGERGEARVENLFELVSAARTFAVEPGSDLDPVNAFLSHAALEAGEGQAARWEDCVQMMTLHSAKGLEFPLVFMSGLEDGIFPHSRSMNDLESLEEERRLCYVGMTRAMRELNLSYAELRRLHGSDVHGQPSRFLHEVPTELIEEIRPRIQVSRPVAFVQSASREDIGPLPAGMRPGMRLGQRVRHGKFGEGVVLNVEGQGAQARVQVNFERQGAKWLMIGYANLEVM